MFLKHITLNPLPARDEPGLGIQDGEVAVWSLKSGKQGKGIGVAVALDAVSQLYWRPDDRALAALDAQGCITVWRT